MDVKQTKEDGSRKQKRRGYAYIPHAQRVTSSQDVRLKKGFVMKNRPGIAASSDNVTEMYFDEAPDQRDKNNYIFIGRGGVGNKLNTGYAEVSAQTNVDKNANVANGVVSLTLVDPSTEQSSWISQVQVRDGRYFGLSDGSVVLLTGDGNDGLVILGVMKNGNHSLSIQIDKEGIYFNPADIPTSDPHYPGQLWRSGTTLKISLG